MLGGEVLTYSPPTNESLGAVALSRRDRFVYARAGITQEDGQESLLICSNNIVTCWDVNTGEIQRITVHPMLKAHIPGLPMMAISFEALEPFLTVQKEVRLNEYMTVENGLLYDGMAETGVAMENGKDATIASRFIRTPLCVRLEWEQHENRIVVESKPGLVEWVRYRRVIHPATVVDLFTNPRVQDQQWRDAIADEVHKLRYQIIESNGF